MARRMRLARACELLLAERERMARENAAAEERADEWARRLAEAIGTIAGLRARVAELTATPPLGTVAALLAKVAQRAKEADRAATQFSGREQEIDASYEEGRSVGLDNAAGMIRDALVPLGAPSPLDAVVAEVVALRAKDAYGTGLRNGLSPDDHADIAARVLRAKGGRFPATLRARLAMAARVLLAGMLACDAKEPTR